MGDIPQATKVQKTTIMPMEPGLIGYETWSHPIVQLTLSNIRLAEKTGTEADRAAKGSQPISSETNRK